MLRYCYGLLRSILTNYFNKLFLEKSLIILRKNLKWKRNKLPIPTYFFIFPCQTLSQFYVTVVKSPYSRSAKNDHKFPRKR